MDSITNRQALIGGGALSLGIGAVAGGFAHHDAKKEIKTYQKNLDVALEAQKKGPDEKAIREESRKFWGKNVPEDIFESSVQSRIDSKKKLLAIEADYRAKVLKLTKDFNKGAGIKAAIAGTIGTALTLGCIFAADQLFQAMAKIPVKVQVVNQKGEEKND